MNVRRAAQSLFQRAARDGHAIKGNYVHSNGSVDVWENPGQVAGGCTESGYDFKGDNLVPATRATFTGVTPRH